MAVSSNRGGHRGDQRRKGRSSGDRGGRDGGHGNNHGHGGHHQYQHLGHGGKDGGYSEPGFMGGMGNPYHQSPFHLLSSTMTVTVQGLTPEVTLLQLRDRFKKYGKTLRVWSVEGSVEGADIAMVTYSGMLEAEAAIRGENSTFLNNAEIKVLPCPYSAAPMSSVNPGDSKYWRCALCHSTNRSSDESCSAYRCTYTKRESDADWEGGGGMKEIQDALATRLEIARQFKDIPAVPAKETKRYDAPHCLAVLNLPSDVTEAQVRRAFTKYGQISTVCLLPPAVEGEESMEALVLYDDHDAMERAIEFENGQAVPGEQRVRVHRVTAPFVVSITPAEKFDIADDAEREKLRDGLFTTMRDFGAVRDVDVKEDGCRVFVWSLRSVVQAIAALNDRTFHGRVVRVHLSNCDKTKWPCMRCFIINPPGNSDCIDCKTPRPDFAAMPFLEMWREAVATTARAIGKTKPVPPASGPAGGGGNHAPSRGQKNQRGSKNAANREGNKNHRQRSGDLANGQEQKVHRQNRRDRDADYDGRPQERGQGHGHYTPDYSDFGAGAVPRGFQVQKLSNESGNVLAMLEQATQQGPPPVAMQGKGSPPPRSGEDPFMSGYPVGPPQQGYGYGGGGNGGGGGGGRSRGGGGRGQHGRHSHHRQQGYPMPMQ